MPSFESVDDGDDGLIMIYTSPRKMCMLAEGLISGAAKHFDTTYTLDHSKCMHNGDDCCEFHLKFAA
ncbi:MAG: heme NO-binding domain-containing protein [Pseudomonadota bacterium]